MGIEGCRSNFLGLACPNPNAVLKDEPCEKFAFQRCSNLPNERWHMIGGRFELRYVTHRSQGSHHENPTWK
jgi:hypothetical protein